tara:strand:+ start:3132 stop:3491 length:360 start_codon:yes stop_codon:yes gene_type:complete
MSITDRKTIEDFFNDGHFDVHMPDGQEEDYDIAIPDYYAAQKGLGECMDSNGSESFVNQIMDDGTAIVDFLVYEREYEQGEWDQKNLRATGKLVEKEEDWLVYHINRLEELPDDYDPFE